MTRIVWIVEDSPLAARIACEALGAEFVCEVFATASDVLERLATRADLPEVMLIDWELPDISGVDLCRALRGEHHDLALPILFVTSRRDKVVEGLAAGANDFVPKPYAPEELLARVVTLARTRELWRRSILLETQLATTLRSIGDAVISTDAEGRVAFMNRVAEQLTGWTQSEATGQPVEEVFRVERNGHTVLLRRGGSETAIDDSAAPIRDPSGTLTGAVLVFRDVSERRRIDAERERLLVDARTRAEFERQLIGIVSHDLRGPLSTITLGMDIVVASERMEEKTLKTLLRIKRATTQATRLVSDLLDFTQARIGSGIPIVRSFGNLHAAIRQIVEDVQMTFPDRDVRVTTAGDGHGHWDSERLSQVVSNLVGNALKYGPASIINVTCEGTSDGITVSVHNHGPTIAEANIGRIFEPMQRATSHLENSARSVGLGLFIVRHLVEAHGGFIAVTSTEDAGTTFRFWVPKAAQF